MENGLKLFIEALARESARDEAIRLADTRMSLPSRTKERAEKGALLKLPPAAINIGVEALCRHLDLNGISKRRLRNIVKEIFLELHHHGHLNWR